jgi:hypothetical protein
MSGEAVVAIDGAARATIVDSAASFHAPDCGSLFASPLKEAIQR